MREIYITSTGFWHPQEIVTNDEIVNSYNTYVTNFNEHHADDIANGSIKELPLSSAEFVEKASGIKTRYLIDKKNTLDPNLMRPQVNNEDESRISIHARAGIEAAKKAIENTDLEISDIDAVIVGTSHAPRNYPAVAIEIQNELGIEGYAYDMLVGCSSTTFAINNAFTDIHSGLAKNILVINPEINSPHVDFGRRDVHFIFGDACVATIVSSEPSSDSCFKIIDRKLVTKFSNNIRSDFGYLNRVSIDKKSEDELLFYQNGRSVFKEVCPMVADLISSQLENLNIESSTIKKFWLHQANSNMCRWITSKILGTDDFDKNKLPMAISDYGNLASAGSLVAFHLYNDLVKGDKGVICSFGAGYSICSLLVEKV